MTSSTSLGPEIWQISALSGSASYAETFIRNGVALVGPGDAGEWRPNRNDADFDGGAVRRFASHVKQGDVFLLRTAVNSIDAVGLVASDYLFLDQFDDVYGRDLQHARRIRWCPLPQEYEFTEDVSVVVLQDSREQRARLCKSTYGSSWVLRLLCGRRLHCLACPKANPKSTKSLLQ